MAQMNTTNGVTGEWGRWLLCCLLVLFTLPVFGADILLVDDDDNSPDVRSYYTAALNALSLVEGTDYDVFDTNNSDNEPDHAYLSQYDTVIWFTGDSSNNATGPGPDGELALSYYLDGSGCLFLSSKDYYQRSGLNNFMGFTTKKQRFR